MRTSVSVVDNMRTDLATKYWDLQPCNIKHSNKEVGSDSWSREVTIRKYFVEPHIREFVEFYKWKDKQVLEIGCGIGTDTIEFAKAGANVTAVDISIESIRLAFKRAGLVTVHNDSCIEFAINRIEFEQLNAEQGLPQIHDCNFDLVYSFGVIHHTLHPDAIVDTVFRKLKPSGEFRLMLYSKWSLKNLLGKQYEAQTGCPIVRKYTLKTVGQLLKQFEIVSIKKTFIFPWRLKEYKQYEYVKAFPYSIMPKWIFNFLQRLLGEHLLIICKKPV